MATQKDFVSDQNTDLLSFALNSGLMPDYVKKANVITQEECDSQSQVAFADPVNRKFPCHSKEACWLSAAYCAGRNIQDKDIAGRIDKLASMHGISDDVEAVRKAFADEFSKAASAAGNEHETQYALTITGADGKDTGFYPMDSRSDIVFSSEKAASDFSAGTLPLPIFMKVASILFSAAERAGLERDDLDPVVNKYGEPRLPNPHTASVFVGSRKMAGVDMAPYNEVISVRRERIVKAASLKDAIDEGARLVEDLWRLDSINGVQCRNGINDPYTCVMSGPTMEDMKKMAASTVNIMNVHVPVTDIANLGDATIDSVFSKEAGTVIREARDLVSGEVTVERSEEAETKLAGLNDTAKRILLSTLAGVGW